MLPGLTAAGEGEMADLGVAKMRLLLTSDDTAGRVSAGEFTGPPGPWTVPHLHRELEEVFYVVSGVFTFTVGDVEQVAEQGAVVKIPRETSHVFRAEAPGTVLVLWTPAGLENMFLELGRLPQGDLTDPLLRAEISKRYDSIPMGAQ